MSKIGNWVLDMEEYAQGHTREEFIKKYGEAMLIYGIKTKPKN